jgi:26S proteasome regulatory subunit N1
LEQGKEIHKIGALLGLSFTYAGSNRAELLEIISPLILDSSNTIELSAIASLALGLIFVGSCDNDAAETILQTIMERSDEQLQAPMAKFLAVGYGLLFLGKQEAAEASLSVIQTMENSFSKFVELVVETFAYAGTGNVLKIQKLLHICAEHKEETESGHQIAAVLGVALIALGEKVGSEMSMRTMNNLLQYGEPVIRKCVPLALALLK